MQITIDLTPILERLDRFEEKLDAIKHKETFTEILDTDDVAAYLGVRAGAYAPNAMP